MKNQADTGRDIPKGQAGPGIRDAKQDKLAAALRQNLLRRKASGRDPKTPVNG